MLWAGVAGAQVPPFAELNAQYLPSSEVPDTPGIRAQVSSYDAVVNVPLALGKRTFLIPGAQYHVDSVSYQAAPPGFIRLDALHSVDVPVLLAHQLSETWALALRVWPGAAGDFERFDSGALHVGGLLMASWSPSERLTLGGGPLASYAFGELLPLPMLYADWKPRRWFRLEASLPYNTSATFMLGDRVELGGLADVSGNEYAVRKEELRGVVDHVAYSVVMAGGVARVRLWSSLWFQSFFGRTLFRRYDLKDARGDLVQGGSVELPNELAFRAGFVFRIPTPDEPSEPEAPR